MKELATFQDYDVKKLDLILTYPKYAGTSLRVTHM